MPNSASPKVDRHPRDDEIQLHGLTHVGHVRANNQDHFLRSTVHRRIEVLQTSLTDPLRLHQGDERLAILAMIADGVGGLTAGETASATALEIAMQYITSSLHVYDRNRSSDIEFVEHLQDAAMRCHQGVVARAVSEGEGKSMATTLTLFLGVWPWYYLVQVGHSRCYLYRDAQLTQITRDQTLVQDLVDQGVFTRAVAAMTSARDVCEQLLQDVLEGGGTDNVTIIVGRAMPQ